MKRDAILESKLRTNLKEKSTETSIVDLFSRDITILSLIGINLILKDYQNSPH